MSSRRVAMFRIAASVKRISLYVGVSALVVRVNEGVASAVQERVDRSLREEEKEMKKVRMTGKALVNLKSWI